MSTRLQTFDARTIAAPAPVTGWRRMLGDWLVVSGATTVCHALGIATSLLLRMLLSPAQMGVWQALKLLLSYGNYANLGISKGAVREFTVALGRRETSNAERGLNLAFTVNTVTSLLYAAVLITAGVWIGCAGGGRWSGAWAAGMIAVGGLAVLWRYVTFHVTILRSKQDFATTSQLSILEAVLTLVVGGLATWQWGLPGLYGATLLVMAAALVYIRPRRAVTIRWAWDAAEIRRLVIIGGPILLAGSLSSVFRSLDKLMILAYLPDREFQLGCYSLALLVSGQLFGLGNMLSMVMGPRYGEKYGRSGDRREVARLAARASELLAGAMALPAALALVAATPLLGWLLPKYQTGLAPLVWLVPGALALALSLPASQYLIAVDRQRRALAAVVAATALAAVANHLALNGGYGLPGVAVATTAGYVVYLVIVVGVSLWIELESFERFRYLAMLGLALGPTIGMALLLERLWPSGEAGWPSVAAKIAAVAVAWGLSVSVGWHHGGWGKQIKAPLAA